MISGKSPDSRSCEYTVLLVCDFQSGLVSRILDVYRFFRRPPRVVLVRKGEGIMTDPRLSVQVEVIPLTVRILESSGFASVLSAMLSGAAYLLTSLALYLKIRLTKVPPRIVHAHFIFPQGLFGLILARLFRVPLVVTAAGRDVNLMMKKSAALRAACLLILKRAQAVIAVSKPLQLSLHRFGVSNCIYLPNSVDTSSIRPLEPSMREDSILFVGSLIVRKQPLLLVRAFKRVVEEVPTATLLMCGDGPLRETIQEELLREGLQDRVMIFSRVSNEFLTSLRARAGIFVLPSLSEGLSLALLEAMAAGQTVVASRNESHLAILEHGKDSLLFDVGDSQQLAREILRALTNETLRSETAKAARYLCETQFSNKVVAERLESLYLRAIGQPNVA